MKYRDRIAHLKYFWRVEKCYTIMKTIVQEKVELTNENDCFPRVKQ